MRSVCFVFALVLGAGCAFEPPGLGSPSAEDPPDEPSGGDEAALCDAENPDLRLCVDFDAPLGDRSLYRAALAPNNVMLIQRDGESAAALTATSSIHIPEGGVLDIDNAMTLEMWIRPTGTPTPSLWMIDNNQQYAASFTAERTIRCQIGMTLNHTSKPIPDDGAFHHVACAYDQATLKVYVDGSISSCLRSTVPIPRSGPDGLAIGANLSGTNEAPTFKTPFVGDLDNVRVWSRADIDICAAANRTDCKRMCD